MATGLARPITRSLKGRLYATSAATKLHAGADEKEPLCFVKKLKNGITVGSIESKSPVSRLAVVVSAGSRNESEESLGVSHVLRHLTKLRTTNLSSLGITRSSLQLGSDITVLSGREYLYFKSGVTRNCAGKIVEILKELTTKTKIVNWEFDDLLNDPNGLKLDLAILKTQPQILAVEALHTAAFRNTLGRSLYAPEFMVGKYTPEQVQQYINKYFSAGRLALVGVGIDQEELEEFGQTFEPYQAVNVPQQQAVYYGGELRDNSGGELSYVALACGGPRQFLKSSKAKKEKQPEPSLGQTSKDLLPSEVLKHILGTGPHIKYSSGTATSALGKAVLQATDSPFAVSSFSANYTDAGLFGFTAVAPKSEIEKVVRAAASQMRTILSSGVSEADVSRAKNQLKAEICMNFENPDNLLAWLGEQSLNADHILTPHEIYGMVDKITTADVNNVAKKISNSKPSLGAAGNTSNVPYLDSIFS
ncbi:unnamed protein product [Lymnaea stagnalis]|uniref:Uncharacterized protein n=1 Tax=Lymnaea stagnalis TaxID=6523 RepID=A0AAV2H511_LYMST